MSLPPRPRPAPQPPAQQVLLQRARRARADEAPVLQQVDGGNQTLRTINKINELIHHARWAAQGAILQTGQEQGGCFLAATCQVPPPRGPSPTMTACIGPHIGFYPSPPRQPRPEPGPRLPAHREQHKGLVSLRGGGLRRSRAAVGRTAQRCLGRGKGLDGVCPRPEVVVMPARMGAGNSVAGRVPGKQQGLRGGLLLHACPGCSACMRCGAGDTQCQQEQGHGSGPRGQGSSLTHLKAMDVASPQGE